MRVLPIVPSFAGKRRPQSSGDDFFCKVSRGDIPRQIVVENQTAFAVLDQFPVNPGHVLVVPKRHVASFFDATARERADIMRLLDASKQRIQQAMKDKKQPVPENWNIGINVGPYAGQTVDHLHVHLIPRMPGDMIDPKGGVRGVIPEKQKYDGPPDTTVDDLLG